MSVQELTDGFSSRGGSSMRLPLHHAVDHHGNAFPISSSSSSCSSSCMGESSPESLRSLSSLSGGRTDSPLDYDVLEVPLTTGTDVVLSKWTPEDERRACDEGEESLGKTGADFSESNSASIYLDATSGEYLRSSWNDLTLSTSSRSHGNCENGRGRSSTASDSDATEIPGDDDDDDDDEEEALFVSVSSDMCVRGDGGTRSHVNTMTELHAEEAAANSESSEAEPKLCCPDPPSEDLSESSSSSPFSFDSAQDVATPSSAPPERSSERSEAAQTGQGNRTGPAGLQTKRAPEVDQRSVKANTGSWSSRSAYQAKPSPVCNKRAPPRKEQCTVGKPVKVAIILRPTRGKSSSKTRLSPAQAVAPTRPGSEVDVQDVPVKPVGTGPRGPGEDPGEAAEGPEDASEKPRSPEQNVPSRPAARQQGERWTGSPPRTGTGPPGPAERGSGSPPREEQSQSQSVSEPCVLADRAPQSPTAASPKPPANQQPACRPAASKLPVKGSNPGPSPVGGGGISGAAGRGSRTQEHPVRRTLSPTSPSSANPPGSTCSSGPPCEAAPGAPQRPASSRSRQVSVQTRTSAGLKPPKASSSSQTAARAPPAGSQTKLSASFQRSGSARFCRPGGAVDRNQREGPRPPSSSSQICSPAAGNQQNQQNHQNQPPELVSDVTNANSPGSAVLPAADPPSTTGFRTRTGPRQSPKTGSRLQNGSRPGAGGAAEKQNKEERKNQAAVQLRRLLLQGNRRVEALATVIQHLFSAREEALKQKTELSAELTKLRGELAASAQTCQRLQREKEEARLGFEESLRRQQEQHQEELQQLEDRLRTVYQEEWDKCLQEYQEEADRFRASTEQQVEQLRSRHEAELRSQEECHSQRAESERQQHAASVEGMRSVHQGELQELQSALKETQTSMEDRISALTAETEELNQKLRVEEERRRQILSDKNLKDSHTVYLERELESLKVVLDLKNNQLHQKEKKLMEMEKMVEVNVKLEETLKKVQQENEDYKARMDKHAALSRQLSTEQALLQQTLQKESKVNKRLSMENEELLWKLHNGDLLASPRRLSPTSPYGSPRNSASFPTATPLSPR
ncbi:microtubule-associated tumor suppressor 1 homolog [Oryzias melastigma]|uniref:Microtubule-associated tumor suppressor 1 homolog n=1 Tax=Oryzias melastigma TaxID=30732 RepID=A0A3B3C0R5_ORYME|nr:microtubule-associated tumor suppressor 1 homolog [Oryzias melastigma]